MHEPEEDGRGNPIIKDVVVSPSVLFFPASEKSDNLIFAKKIAITVTEAARNFADCINRARYQDVTFLLLKNGTAVAQIVPNNEKI